VSGPDPLTTARLAWMKRDAGRTLEAAQPHCTSANPDVRLRALVLCAEALGHLGHHGRAANILRTALSLDPTRVQAWSALATLLTNTGNHEQAAAAWQNVAIRSPRDPQPWLSLADTQRALGRPADAAQSVQQARRRAPHRADLVHQQVADLRTAGREHESHDCVMAALHQFPTDLTLHLLAAEGFAALGRRDDCLAHLNRAVAIDPHHVPALSRRANFFIQTRRITDAQADITALLAESPDNPHGVLQAARLAMLQRDEDHALALLNTLLADESRLGPTNLGNALLYRAELMGKRGALDHEWADLTRAQATLAQPQLDRGEDGTEYLEMVARRTRLLTPGSSFRTAASTLPMRPPAGSVLIDRPPVFMFGFPRSGTTLAERILGAHPNLTATDELNLLGAVFHSIATELQNAPMEELTDAQVRHLRRAFVEKAVRAGFSPSTQRLIDKNPLNFVFIDVVRRVFPDSPVIFILRDPRDCVWSSFRQAFDPNPALILTRDLTGAARLYRDVFDLWEQGRTVPGLRLTELHYEHLVADFEHGARALVQAAGEAWDPAVLEFHQKLGNAYVRTPSFAAVGQTVNRSRLARWRRHADKMEAVAPTLAPYIQRYGVETVAPELVSAGD
jgi:tetratricopeptide (TPR) repeat protein